MWNVLFCVLHYWKVFIYLSIKFTYNCFPPFCHHHFVSINTDINESFECLWHTQETKVSLLTCCPFVCVCVSLVQTSSRYTWLWAEIPATLSHMGWSLSCANTHTYTQSREQCIVWLHKPFPLPQISLSHTNTPTHNKHTHSVSGRKSVGAEPCSGNKR